MPREPTVAGLQHKPDIVRRGDHAVGVVLFQMMDFLDHAVGADVGGGDGFGAVHHPEIGALRGGQDKDHRVRILDVRAEHHAGLLLDGSQRQFGIQSFRAKVNLHRRQFRLRLLGQLVVQRGRRGAGFSFFTTGEQRGRQQQRDQFSRLHADKLPDAAAVFNQYGPVLKWPGEFEMK